MALIECTECGKMISDKASACPHCGCPVEKKVTCEECGSLFPANLKACPNCGCPVNLDGKGTSGVCVCQHSVSDVNSPKMQYHHKSSAYKKWLIGVILLVALVVCSWGVYQLLCSTEEDIVVINQEFIDRIHKYDAFGDFSEGYAAVNKGGKWGFINTKGEEVIPCKYDGAKSFSGGYAAIENGGKWGFINTKGEEVIPCKYESVWGDGFSVGYAEVYKNEKWERIDEKGEQIQDNVNVFSKGLKWMNKDGMIGVVDANGKEIIPCKYGDVWCADWSYLYDFREGFAAVVDKNWKWGFVNTRGEEVIPCKYDGLFSFHEGYAAVEKDGKWGFVNTKGEEVVSCKYEEGFAWNYYFSEGFAGVKKDEKWGAINTKGEEVIPFKYDDVFHFSNGYAEVYKNNKFGLINTKGEEVVPCKYDGIHTFSNGVALVYLGSNRYIWGFVDKQGKDTFTEDDYKKLDKYEEEYRRENNEYEW